jgi:hypothetical protein
MTARHDRAVDERSNGEATMLLNRDSSRRREPSGPSKTPHLWEDLLTGLSLAVFIILFICVAVGAWLFESGV